ncbi:hypothetical protein IJH02_03875 [Candidatus Saccharibacteria bacterium]|nr:hypothetical protein [Candidatus Saccharibacteria bacterium]
MNVSDFARGTEKMVNPMEVGKVHFRQTQLRRLPVWIQRKLVKSGMKKMSRMGFIVEPYAFFLFYEISDPESVARHLPDGFVPARSRVFANGPEKFYGIVSIFRVHTSVFWGARAEFYAIAENSSTGLLSWVILDYASDTISYDFLNGLRSPDVSRAVVTTTCEGEFIAEMVSPARSRHDHARVLECVADLNKAKMEPLDPRLWIEGNTSIAYSRDVGGDDGSLFSLTFLPEEMKQALDVPLSAVSRARVDWFPEIFGDGGKLDMAACFPYAQHMLSDTPGHSTHYGSEEALRKAAEKVRF